MHQTLVFKPSSCDDACCCALGRDRTVGVDDRDGDTRYSSLPLLNLTSTINYYTIK